MKKIKTERDTGSPGSSSFDEENSNFATRTRHTAGVLPNDSIDDSEPIVKPSNEFSSENSSGNVTKSKKTISKPKDKLPTRTRRGERRYWLMSMCWDLVRVRGRRSWGIAGIDFNSVSTFRFNERY